MSCKRSYEQSAKCLTYSNLANSKSALPSTFSSTSLLVLDSLAATVLGLGIDLTSDLDETFESGLD